MKRVSFSAKSAVVSLFVLCSSSAGLPAAAAAQQQAPPISRAGTRPAADILARISQGAGVTVVADATITERLPLPATPITPQNVEQQIAEVVKALPEGATWAKLYLPGPPAGRAWRGDDVAAYALAQKRLFGKIGAVPPGTIEIMGQQFSAADAQDMVARLKLRPVYLITNPSKKQQAAQGLNEWAQMTPEQREAYAQQQAAQLLAADPAVRQQTLMQQAMVFRSMFQQMTPDQRQQMMQGMQQFFQNLGPGR